MAFIDGGGSQTFGGMRWTAVGLVAACSVALLDPVSGARSPSLGVPLRIAVANNGGTNSDVQIIVATDAAFTAVVWPGTLTNVVNGNYTVQPTGLVVTTVYYWRARAAPTGTTTWGPWSETRTFAVDLNAGKAWGYSYENVGIDSNLLYAGEIDYSYENVGVEVTLYAGAADYSYQNVGVEVTLASQAVDYVYEGDVNALTPDPHIWWLIPTAGRSGDGISVVGFGFGDLPGTYNGALEIDYGGRQVEVQHDDLPEYPALPDWHAWQSGYGRSSYQVVGSGGAGSDWVLGSPVSSGDVLHRTFTGLVIGTAYRVTMRARSTGPVVGASVTVGQWSQDLYLFTSIATGSIGGLNVWEDLTCDFVATATSHEFGLKANSGSGGNGNNLELADVSLSIDGGVGWTALGAISWQTFPPNADAYTAARHMNANLGETDMQHQVIECVVPMNAVPPGYPLRVRTEGGA